jgi:chromosome segregation ATPase
MSGTSDSSNVRKILEQKDKEMDSIRSELRSAQAESATWKRKLEVKEREIEDVKNQLRRTAKGDANEQSEEIARYQIMLLDLKTTRVDLLEKLDDSEHEVEKLRNEVKILKGRQVVT